MIKSRKLRTVCLFVCGMMLVGSLTGCKSGSAGSDPASGTDAKEKTEQAQTTTNEIDSEEATRENFERIAEELKAKYQQNSGDEAIGLEYAQTLYTLGDFEKSREIVSPLLNKETISPDAIYLSAELEYLNGNYDKAEEQYKILTKEHYDDYGLAAEAGLQMVYYQTNEYSKAKELFVGQDLENPMLDMMKAFDDTPYQIDWKGEMETTIPFVTTDPLPVVPIEINGERINAFIDTGGSTLIVDEAIAADLGIETIANDTGAVAVGDIDFAFGKINSMKLGDVDIKNIPVTLVSFEGISYVFEGYATNVHAIIGTNVLQQFIPIMNYPSGQLTLIQRDMTGEAQLSGLLANDTILEEVPFTLASTHFMFAKGSINGKSGLNMFVDSGGADDKGAGIFVYKKTMDLLNIPLPDKMTSASGVGESDFAQGWFDLASYSLGNLQMEQGIGIYDTSGHSDDLIDTTGFFGDALISHNYLKQYKWTIDFDSMTMTFSE